MSSFHTKRLSEKCAPLRPIDPVHIPFSFVSRTFSNIFSENLFCSIDKPRTFVYNKNNRNEVKTAIKKLNAALDAADVEAAKALIPATFSLIDSAVSKGIMHKNTAANKKSGLAKRLNALSK